MLTPRNLQRYDELRSTKRTLRRLAPWVSWGLLGLGASLALEQGKSLVSDAQLTWAERQILSALAVTYLGGFGLAGWVVGQLLRAAGELMEVMADQAESTHRATELLERHAIPTLGRIVTLLESSGDLQHDSTPSQAIKEAREAIRGKRWSQADRLVTALVKNHPGPEAARLLAELADARQLAIDDLYKRLDAAQSKGDASGVIDARDALTQHLRGSDLDELDQRLASWLVLEIKARAKAGPIRADLAELTARVVDSFGDTVEAQALRSSLPNLRRAAGLCAECGKPRKSDGETCRHCQAFPIEKT
jgi:hypothetical protein